MVNKNALKIERQKKETTQRDIAKALSIAKETYSKKENNKLQFTILEMLKIERYLSLGIPKMIDIFLRDLARQADKVEENT